MEKALSTLLLNKEGYTAFYLGGSYLIFPKAIPESRSVFPLPVGEPPKERTELPSGASSIGTVLIIVFYSTLCLFCVSTYAWDTPQTRSHMGAYLGAHLLCDQGICPGEVLSCVERRVASVAA